MTQSDPIGPKFEGVAADAASLDVNLLFVPVFQDESGGDLLPRMPAAVVEALAAARSSGEFRARAYEIFVTSVTEQDWKAARVAFIGAGKSSEWDVERRKRVAAAAGYAARKRAAASIGWVVRGAGSAVDLARSAADGLSAAEFDIGAYKHDNERTEFPSRVVITAPGADATAVQTAVRHGRAIGEAANVARGLANEPGNVLTPRVFAARVAAMAESAGLSVEVLDDTRLRAMGMGLLLGVSQGSAEPPRMVVLRYDPPGAPAAPVLGFVGKGITFDSGGISIKPAEGMDRMKDDMSGGAAVAASMAAITRLGGPCRIIGVIPMSENMPGSRATRPGDVLTGAGGKTVEIINTDAEGRLILGDAMWYVQELGATHIVDVATLTGACVVALGKAVSGLFGNDENWVKAIAGAGSAAGDRLWHMPIYEEARDQLKSEIADMLNSAGRPGGAVTGAAFIREFVNGRAWAHMDIAGTAWAEEARPYQPKGPTGVAVRTLIELGMTSGNLRSASAG